MGSSAGRLRPRPGGGCSSAAGEVLDHYDKPAGGPTSAIFSGTAGDSISATAAGWGVLEDARTITQIIDGVHAAGNTLCPPVGALEPATAKQMAHYHTLKTGVHADISSTIRYDEGTT